MAIKSINELTAMTTADLTANDVLVVGTSSGAKKIPAQDAFSGGGESNVALFEIDYNGGNFRTVETASEIKELVDAGKAIIGVANPVTGQTVQVTISVIMFGSTNDLYGFFYDPGSSQVVTLHLSAATLNDVFTVA